MTALYDCLNDTRPSFIGPKHWLGNLRWFAQEEKEPGAFTFKTAPMDATEQERENVYHAAAEAIRTLFGVEITGAGEVQSVDYRPDGMTATFEGAQWFISLPLERYSALLTLESGTGAILTVKTPRALGKKRVVEKVFQVETSPGRLVWKDGDYTIAFRFSGQPELTIEGSFALPSPESGPAILVSFRCRNGHFRSGNALHPIVGGGSGKQERVGKISGFVSGGGNCGRLCLGSERGENRAFPGGGSSAAILALARVAGQRL